MKTEIEEINELYQKGYSLATKFILNPDERFRKILDKLNDDEYETLRDRFADFFILIKK